MLDDLRSLPSDVDEDAAFLIPGARFGRYTLVRRLAIGGMAEIHLARASGLSGFEKTVVLKRILPQYAVMDDFVEMFLDEARLGASLDHANIVQVHDVGQVGRSYFMAMEYLQGQDVRNVQAAARKHARPLTLGEALSIAIPTAAGLHYAHEKRGADGRSLNVVHRDVSPANIIVTRDGCVKIVDFGIAKSAIRNTQTRAGTLKGKISYMSPEQCRGDAIDRRSDVFALGIVLYELCCGVRPFNGDNEYAILSQIIGSVAPAPSLKDPDFPVELERILLKALKPLPEDRYQSTRELQADLEGYARHSRLEIGPMVLAEMLESLAFTYRTDVQGVLPEGVSLPASAGASAHEPAPIDDELAYSVIMDAGGGSFDDGPSARLENELLAHERSAAALTGSGSRRMKVRMSTAVPAIPPAALDAAEAGIASTSAPAAYAPSHRQRNRWLAVGAAALVLAGIAIGASLGRGSKTAPAAAGAADAPAVRTPRAAPPLPSALPSAQIQTHAAAAARPAEPELAPAAPEAAAAPAAPAPAAKPSAPRVLAAPPAKPPLKAPAKPTVKPAAAKPAAAWDPDSPLPPPH